MRQSLRTALLLGLASGGLEFLLRTQPRLGFGFVDQLIWALVAIAAGMAVTLPLAALGHLLRKVPYVGPRRHGLMLGGLVALHVGMVWRFQVALNQQVGGQVGLTLVGIAIGGVIFGLSMAKHLPRVEKILGLLGMIGFWFGFIKGLPPGPNPVEGPNVLVVTLDTTRPDRLGVYGGPAPTPHLQELADRGARFDQAIATAPLTEPSHLSILTGLNTTTTGIVSNGTDLGPQPALLHHAMREEGLRTGAVVSGFPLHSRYGWHEGWDVYDDDFGALAGVHQLSLGRLLENLLLPHNTLRERPGDRTVRRAKAFLSRQEVGRWFLWVHLFDPHAPYESSDLSTAPRDGEPLELPGYWPPPHRAVTSIDWLTQAYDDELTHTDLLVGQLIGWLKEHDQLDDTLIVVVADHGESLTEHGLLFDHGDNLYDPSLKVPLIIAGPGVDAGLQVPCQVSTTDIAPTVRALLGLPELESDGRSLVEVLQGETCEDQRVLSTTVGMRFVEEPPVDLSLRDPAFKLIRLGQDRGEELYDLVNDPDEATDLSGQSELLDYWSEALDAELEGRAVDYRPPSMDQDNYEMLQQLGYLEAEE